MLKMLQAELFFQSTLKKLLRIFLKKCFDKLGHTKELTLTKYAKCFINTR